MDLLCDDVVYYEVGTWVTSLGSGSTSLDNSDLIIIHHPPRPHKPTIHLYQSMASLSACVCHLRLATLRLFAAAVLNNMSLSSVEAKPLSI